MFSTAITIFGIVLLIAIAFIIYFGHSIESRKYATGLYLFVVLVTLIITTCFYVSVF